MRRTLIGLLTTTLVASALAVVAQTTTAPSPAQAAVDCAPESPRPSSPR